MTSHSSASVREPHANRISRTKTIINALKQRAEAVLNDKSIDPQSRAIIRQALETNDPWLAELVRRSDADGSINATFDLSQEADTSQTGSGDEHIEALAEIICGAGNESAATLFVLMGKLENSTHPDVLAHTAKHFAFTRCGELNVFGMVDAQIAIVEAELFANMS